MARPQIQAANTKIAMEKYMTGIKIILLVSANQSAAVSIIAIDTLRFLKQHRKHKQ